MNFQMPYANNLIDSPLIFQRRQKRWLLICFWLLLTVVVLQILTADVPFLTMLAALLIAVMALLPSYFWCCDRAKGLPLFPIMALTYLWTHALPLISKHPRVILYSEEMHFEAAIAVAIFLGVGTIVWLSFFNKHEYNLIPDIKTFRPQQITPFFLTLIFLCIIFNITWRTGFLWLLLPTSVISALRNTITGLAALGIILLGYKLGSRTLRRRESITFILLMLCLVFEGGTSLYLNIIGTYVLIGMVGFTLGSGKLPWRLLIISVLIVAFLNMGKGETRADYWQKQIALQPWQYPGLYVDWVNNSLKKIDNPTAILNTEQEGNLSHRQSVVHMLLKVISETGKEREYLNGATYAIIPQLLIPRFLNENKIRGNEANQMLSVHYGLQTYEATYTTSIGWGLLQEAYANFGWIGCIGLGTLLGIIYGWITYWSINVPISSYRFLIAIVFITLSFRSENTLGTFISVIFQNIIVLFFIVRNIFMKHYYHGYYPIKNYILNQQNK